VVGNPAARAVNRRGGRITPILPRQEATNSSPAAPDRSGWRHGTGSRSIEPCIATPGWGAGTGSDLPEAELEGCVPPYNPPPPRRRSACRSCQPPSAVTAERGPLGGNHPPEAAGWQGHHNAWACPLRTLHCKARSRRPTPASDSPNAPKERAVSVPGFVRTDGYEASEHDDIGAGAIAHVYRPA
jgi:hypothetical protein